MHHPELPVRDVRAAAAFYQEKLGFKHGFTWGDPVRMIGVNLGGVSVHLRQGTPAPEGFAVYFVVGDADELHDFQRTGGVDIVRPLQDQPWGFRDFMVSDLDGNKLMFGHRLPEGPPLKIERVDVPVRLEKRLAAVLRDLADHKGMSLDSCLEETLLHTFERVGDAGVASPHTRRTLDVIEDLKKKHGLDYEAHASYRFVEE
jgi:uncharacterized glyoxalase superfamily protein PhnB